MAKEFTINLFYNSKGKRANTSISPILEKFVPPGRGGYVSWALVDVSWDSVINWSPWPCLLKDLVAAKHGKLSQFTANMEVRTIKIVG